MSGRGGIEFMLQEAAGLTTELRTTATDFDLGWSSALALQLEAISVRLQPLRYHSACCLRGLGKLGHNLFGGGKTKLKYSPTFGQIPATDPAFVVLDDSIRNA